MKQSALFVAALFAASLSTASALTVPVAEDTSTETVGQAKVVAPSSGTATTLAVNSKQSALVRFDLTDLEVVPAVITPDTLKSAILRLYVVSAKPTADVTIHAITSTWTETFTGRPVAQPTIDPTVLKTIPAADLRRKAFVSVDLTAEVAAALESGNVFGFALETSDPKARIVFASKEGPAAGEAAQLDLDADLSSGGPASASLTLTGNLTLPATTASAGILYAGSTSLLHDFGFQNFFAGPSAGNFTMTGTGNAAVGYQSLSLNTSGNFNAALGYQTLRANTSGLYNTASGFQALTANTSGFSNTAAGAGALQANVGGYQNSAMGDDALTANTSGNNNTASGYASLFQNQGGNNNSAFGGAALYSNSADNNSALGYSALYSNTTGASNVAAGYQALYANHAGNLNTASGVNALFSNVNGSNNTASGASALFTNSSGYENAADGVGALYANTSAFDNSAMGFHSLYQNTTGVSNTAIGAYALSSNKIGSYNIAIGVTAGASVTENNTICIGYAGGGLDGAIWIGDTTFQTAAFIAGIYGTGSGTPGVPVYVAPNGKLYTSGSSERFKDSIASMEDASDVLLQLRPVTFRYKPEYGPHDVPQFGLIAEEVNAVAPDLVAHDAKGAIYTVRYDAVNAMLLNEFLKEHERVKEQGAELARQKQAISTLEARLAALEARVSAPAATTAAAREVAKK